MAPGSGLLSTQALSRGYTDRGLYGYRNHDVHGVYPSTKGPGEYTPYAQINTPTHRMVSAQYYPDRERSRDVLHGRDLEPFFLSLPTIERNQPILPQGRPKKPDKALELLPKERLVDDGLFLTLPRSTWCRCPVRSEEVTKRPQEDRERYVRVHARSTPTLLGMRDLGMQTHTRLAKSVLGSNSQNWGGTLTLNPSVNQDWGGGRSDGLRPTGVVKTDSVNTRKLRRRWGQGFGKMNAEGSLMWSRHRDEHQSRYILETYREKQTNAFESQHKDPDSP
jgi:hypothetical protein